MRFHADEHVADAVVMGLRRRGHDVTSTHEAGLQGRSDLEHLQYALKASRVMISHDADLLRLAAAGENHAGIAYCPCSKYEIGQLIRRLLALAADTKRPMRGRVIYL